MIDASLFVSSANIARGPATADEAHAAWLNRVAQSMGFIDAEVSILSVSSDASRYLVEGTAHRSRSWISVRARALTSDAAADRAGRRLRRRLRSGT